VKKTILIVGFLAGILISTTALAQTKPDRPNNNLINPMTDKHLNAIVAGYKAVFTCGGTFSGGKSQEQIGREELVGIYPNYREAQAALPEAVIHMDEKYVSAQYADDMPPRISVWRPHLGCAQLPIGATIGDRDMLPSIDVEMPNNKNKAWPNGDKISKNSTINENLNAVIEGAFSGKYGEGVYTTAVIITTPDQILGEKYLEGFDIHTSHRTWSAAKSIAATVIGAAQYQGIIDVKAENKIPEFQTKGDPRGNITLENFLHMGSGLYSRRMGNRTADVYWGGGKLDDNGAGMSVEAMPGTRWKYANNDTMLAIRSLKGAIGDEQTYLKFPFESLTYKIGMHDTKLETDWGGNFIFSSQVWTTARDLARLGILYLNNGVWDGKRLLPDWWVDYVKTPAPAEPTFRLGEAGYGAQFWLYPKSRFPYLPDDSFAARGNRGQNIMIIPSKGIVIVRRGHDDSSKYRFDLAGFTRDVLKSIE